MNLRWLGITAMLPGEQPVNWRCDPIPLILSAIILGVAELLFLSFVEPRP